MPDIQKYLNIEEDLAILVLKHFYYEIENSLEMANADSQVEGWEKASLANGLSFTDEMLEGLNNLFWDSVRENVKIYDGVKETLEILKVRDIKIIAVSGGDRVSRILQLTACNILKCFDNIETSSMYGVHKNRVDLYRLVAEKYGLSVEESLVVGNSEVSDILLPRNDGFKTVKIARGFDRVLETSADYKITNYNQLLNFF